MKILKNLVLRAFCRLSIRMLKQGCAVAAIFLICGIGVVYLVYFHKPPAEDILAANKLNDKFSAKRPARKALEDTSSEQEDDTVGDAALVRYQQEKWQAWIDFHNHVSIGELYDKCDGNDRLLVGKVVMLQDKKEGGVTSRTYLNCTFAEDITGGEMHIEVKYNGHELYANHWDLCTVEDTMAATDRIIFCPIKKGTHHFVKNLKIPNYLPKGRYQTKAWATDFDENLLGCTYSDFSL